LHAFAGKTYYFQEVVAHMKKYCLIVFVLCALASCASVPEPSFKDGVYTNPEFGFHANLPEGWLNSRPIPPWVLRQIPRSEAPGLKFMFTNRLPEFGIMSKGRILASCSMLELSWEQVMEDKGKFRLQQIKRLDDRKTLLNENPMVKDYFSKTYSLSGHAYPFHLFEEKIDAYNLQIFRDSFLYRCNAGGACYIVFYLLSPPDMIKMNYRAYREVIESLKIQ
jgi:hypothetical protein